MGVMATVRTYSATVVRICKLARALVLAVVYDKAGRGLTRTS